VSAKPTPKVVEELLDRYDPARSNTDPNIHPCEGAEFHSPRPLTTHRYRLANGQSFWLCGTCKDNIDIYVFLWEKNNGLDWSVQRCFGNNARTVASVVLSTRRTVLNDNT
jgi:hypothetical protein